MTANLTGDEGVRKFDTFWQKMLDEGYLIPRPPVGLKAGLRHGGWRHRFVI